MIAEQLSPRILPRNRAIPWPFRRARAVRDWLVESLVRSVLVQLMLAMSLVSAAAMLYLAQASQASVIDFDLAEIKAQQIQLNAENAGLHSQANQLQALQRIDALATSSLHMTKPDLTTTVWVKPFVPKVRHVPSFYPTAGAATESSSPLAWTQRFLTAVRNSL
jgi:cell division protein FtsL